MSEGTTLWTNPENALTTTQLKSVPAFRELLRRCELPIARALAESNTNELKCSASEMRLLGRYILAYSPSSATALSRLLVLSKVVAYVNREYHLSVPAPAIPNVLTRPPNPHKDGSNGVIWAQRCYDAFCEMESRWLMDEEDAPSLELIACSGILHGGLYHPSSAVCAVCVLIAPGDKLGHIGDSVYLELTLPWRGTPNMERRLWFPDRQTASLIGRSQDCGRRVRSGRNDQWRAIPPEKIADVLWSSMRRRMRHYGLVPEFIPTTLKRFVSSVALAASAWLPPILVSFASRKFVSYSLNSDSLDRLRGFRLVQDLISDDEDVTPSGEKNSGMEPSDVDNDPDELLPRVFAPLRAAFSPMDETEVLQKLTNLIESANNSHSAATRIAQFAVYLLIERHRRPSALRHKKPGLSTVYAYTNRLIRRFGALLKGGVLDPVSLPGDDLEAKCVEALEGAHSGKNPRVARNALRHLLIEFTGFLEYKFHIDPISPDVLGTGGGLAPVDATIIRAEDYYEARRYVREDLRGTFAETTLRAAEAQIVLEYRCGIRRMEGVGLEKIDIIDSRPGWILIRPNAVRGVKTKRSLRQAPIHAECSPEELDVISRWKRDLVAGVRYSQNVLMPIVLDALRFATGMRKPRAHHLRHSWASLTFLKLMSSELEEVPNFFPDSPQTMAELRMGLDLRNTFYGHRSGIAQDDEQPAVHATTRKHAYAITSLAGHALCETSAEHYVHVLDQVLCHFLGQSERFSVTTRQFSVAAGCSERTAYSSTASSIPLRLWHKAFGPLAGDGPPEQAVCTASPGTPVRRPFWKAAEGFLMDCHERLGASVSELAEKNGIPVEFAELCARNSFRIGAIREARGRQTRRHPLDPIPDDDRVLPYLQFVPRAVRPTAAKDSYVIASLQHRIEHAVTRDRVLALEALGYFVHNAWLTEEVLLFRDPTNPHRAKRYLQFLEMCDLSIEQVRLVSYDTSEGSRWLRHWAKALRLQEADFELGGIAPFGASDTSDRWLAIEPNLSGVRIPANRSVPGASGFRYLMTMAATVFGFDDVQRE